MCVERDTQGIIKYNIYPANHYELQISSTTVTINGNAMGFDTSSSKCPYTSFLGVESFSWNVGELIIDSTLAGLISSTLTSYAQLPMESCLTQSSAGMCETCVARYTPNSQNCDPLPYGYETASTCYAPFQYDNQANRCVDGKRKFRVGTGAFPNMQISNDKPKSSRKFGASAWTAQFYLLITPLFQDVEAIIEEKVLKFQNQTADLFLHCYGVQQFASGANYLELKLNLISSLVDVSSSALVVPYGEWLVVTIQAQLAGLVYTLKVQNYGSITLQGQSHLEVTKITFRAGGIQMAHLVKELLIWESAIAENSDISSHQCNFDHAASFLPYFQYNLNFTRASTDTEIVDERGVATTASITNLGALTVGEAVEMHPPIAPLPATLLFSNLANSAACVECMPNCKACTDIFTCTECSSGTLVGGICITNTVSPNQGEACSTVFTYDTSEISQINRYLNNVIREASLTQQISFSAKLIYPDSTQTQIPDLRSFTAPNIVGLTSYEAQVRLTFTLNSVSTQTDLGAIALTQPAQTSSGCRTCMPNCSLCSDLYVCQACSSGTLIGGLCFTQTISPSSGDACSSTFSFDASDFTTINTHINSQLGAASSTQQVSYTSAKVLYPDSSEKPISDISSFTIDNYHKVGLTSFEATIKMSFTVNGVAKEEDLTTVSVNQPAKTPPNCMSCMPNCSECSDIFECNICSASNLFGGLCITSTLSPSSGSAGITPFQFDVSEFSSINSHINAQLGVSSSTQQVSFSSLKLSYPDASVVTVNDPSSFTIPIYKVQGLQSFLVTVQLYFTVNGESKHSELARIQMSQTAYIPSNICGCRLPSECNSSTGECICQPGYAGTHCTYTEDQLASLQAQVSSQVNSIEATLGTTTSNQDALTQLKELTSEESEVTDSTALKTNTILSQIVSQSSSQAQLQQVVEVESNLLPKVKSSASDASSLSQSIQDLLAQIVESTVQNGSDISITTTNIFVTVLPLSSSPSPSNQSDVRVTVPTSEISSNCSDTKLSKVLYKGILYQTPSGFKRGSDTLALELYACQVKQNVTNLEEMIELQFPIDQSDSVLAQSISEITNLVPSNQAFNCSFYDSTANKISAEGCTLLDFTPSSIKCGCNHMTDFMVFVKSGESVLTEANYDVILALTELNLDNLQRNIGSYFFLGYWGVYLFLCLIFSVKRRKLDSFYVKVFSYLKKQEEIEECVRENQNEGRLRKLEERIYAKPKAKRVTVRRDPAEFHSIQNNSLSISITLPNNKNTIKDKEIYEDRDLSERHQKPVQLGRSTLVTKAEEGVGKIYISKETMMKWRIKMTLKNEKKCCCAFCKLFKDQLQNNNQIYNFFRGAPIVVPCSLRLAFFFLTLLLEFFLNALFYSLNPPQDEDTPLFWDGIIENFWVSFYSFLFAMSPLLLLGCVFTASGKIKEQLKLARDSLHLKQIYRNNVKNKIRCKTIGGLVFFAVLSNYLLLYIVCFCHVASQRMSEDWLRSSGLLVVLDLFILELFPGILFGVLGLFYKLCNRSNLMICLIVLIESYRFYRNLVEV